MMAFPRISRLLVLIDFLWVWFVLITLLHYWRIHRG